MTEEKVRVVTVNVTNMLYQMRQAGMPVEADFVQALVNGMEREANADTLRGAVSGKYVESLLARAETWLAEDEGDNGYIEAPLRVVGLIQDLSNALRLVRRAGIEEDWPGDDD